MLEPNDWHEIKNVSKDAIICVLASEYYSKKDYISMKMTKIFYENINKSNKIFYDKFMLSLKKVNKQGSYILGHNIKKFEENFAGYLGAKYCVSVANGLDALTISLKYLRLPKNSEVLVASNSYIVCVISILNAGLKPVLVEPDIETYNIDPKQIKKITKNTKAILAVHLYGKKL